MPFGLTATLEKVQTVSQDSNPRLGIPSSELFASLTKYTKMLPGPVTNI